MLHCAWVSQRFVSWLWPLAAYRCPAGWPPSPPSEANLGSSHQPEGQNEGLSNNQNPLQDLLVGPLMCQFRFCTILGGRGNAVYAANHNTLPAKQWCLCWFLPTWSPCLRGNPRFPGQRKNDGKLTFSISSTTKQSPVRAGPHAPEYQWAICSPGCLQVSLGWLLRWDPRRHRPQQRRWAHLRHSHSCWSLGSM